MKLTILGKYGPYPKAGEATSSYLLQGDNSSVAFEMGSGSLSKLLMVLPPEKLDGIVISHSHFDHECDLGALNYYLQIKEKAGEFSGKINVYVPNEGIYDFEYLKYECPYLNLVPVSLNQKYKIGCFEFTFYKMRHPKLCYGFVASAGEKRLGFTGDTNTCEGFDEICSNCDFLLADGCTLITEYSQSSAHLCPSIIDKAVSSNGIRGLITHLLPDVDEELYKREITTVTLEIAKTGESYII